MMRVIGMIGGMSPESTILYYRFINEAARAATGDPETSAPILISSLNFANVAAYQRADDWDGAGDLLAGAARNLVKAGAELIIISANTMHICADAVARAIPGVPLLHIGDVIVKEVGSGAKVLLLGTKYTMEKPFLLEYVRARGVTTEVPDEQTRVWIQNVIYTELARGVVRPESKKQFTELLEGAKRDGYDAVVLACTELGMLVDEDAPIRFIDTARAHAQASVDAALEKSDS